VYCWTVGFFTYRSPHHGSKIWQKIHAVTLLLSRWRSDPPVDQLFCSARTIMARALLNFGFFTYRSPHDGSKICQKKILVGVQLESRWRTDAQVAQLFLLS